MIGTIATTILVILFILYFIGIHSINNNQKELIKEKDRNIKLKDDLLKIQNDKLKRHSKLYDEQKSHADYLNSVVKQLHHYQNQGIQIISVEELMVDIKSLDYDQFIDYLESLSHQELNTIRSLMEENKMVDQIKQMDGYLRNRTKNK